ncbi:MAG: hypothetical protein HY657_06480 [Acidobacteria bacterium]|nr:hypothetical protein [Acidobacteriota bacterium]
MSAAYESANLLLKLYDLRRETTMRQSRQWFVTFNPDSADDLARVMQSEHSAYFRMVTSFWDMAASLVNNGAIDEKMFNDANGEHVVVFAKVEPFLAEHRARMGFPQYLQQLEQLVMRLPNARERLAATRERFRQIAARAATAAGADVARV